eukprot:5358919-Pyramimonas_sp.AAC.1
MALFAPPKRHTLQGLAVFTVAAQGGRAMPTLPPASLLQLSAVKSIFVDSPPDQMPQVMLRLADPGFASVLCRLPSRSPGSSQALPRVRMELVLPVAASTLLHEV